jgi:hypothetical protein
LTSPLPPIPHYPIKKNCAPTKDKTKKKKTPEIEALELSRHKNEIIA